MNRDEYNKLKKDIKAYEIDIRDMKYKVSILEEDFIRFYFKDTNVIHGAEEWITIYTRENSDFAIQRISTGREVEYKFFYRDEELKFKYGNICSAFIEELMECMINTNDVKVVKYFIKYYGTTLTNIEKD